MNRKRGLRCQSGCRFHSYLKWSEINRTHREQTKTKKKNQWQWSEVPKGWVNVLYLPRLIEWRSHGLSFIASSSAGRNGLRNGVRYRNELWSVPFITTFSAQNWKWMHRASMGNLEASILTPLRKISWPARGVAFVNNLVRALIGPWTGTGKCCRGGWWCLPLDQYHSLQ